MGWTEQQQKAIDFAGGSVLVSAAAGSGKTAVLSERAADYIAKGGSADRLLVVTFTKLAAAEMKTKIIAAINKKNIDNDHIRKQKLLIYNSDICTIDSYFGKLVREHFRSSGIRPDYSIMESSEEQYLRESVFNFLIEEYYARGDSDFFSLLNMLGGTDDENIKKSVFGLYEMSQSMPFPDLCISGMVEKYEHPEFWIENACKYLLPEFEEYPAVFRNVVGKGYFSESGDAQILGEAEAIDGFCNFLRNKDWDSVYNWVRGFSFKRKPRASEQNRDTESYDVFRKNFIKKIDNGRSDKLSGYDILHINREELEKDLRDSRDGIRCLCRLTSEFSERLLVQMKIRNKYSFNAIAHYAIDLVLEGNGNTTSLGKSIASGYDQIMIDEYQDVNDLQDAFFSAISDNKCFAVGDVKQSIYMFRQSNPKNFLKKMNEYSHLSLNKNFRSEKGILDFSNFVFSMLFSKDIGGLEYTEEEFLVPGTESLQEKPSVETYFVNTASEVMSDDDGKLLTQARYTAERIKALCNEGIPFSDICILLRSSKNAIPVFEKVFYEEGIPSLSKNTGSFEEFTETSTVLAYLKAINNPYLDVELLASMLSPFGGFTCDDIAQIRHDFGNGHLYDALVHSAEKKENVRCFLNRMDSYRVMSRCLPVYKLIWKMYIDSEYLEYVLCQQSGSVRYDRLMALYNYAVKAESGTNLPLFLRYAENAGASSQESVLPKGNYVRIMTIHASKGLEFPVCIIPQMSKDYNFMDNRNLLFYDPELGVGGKLHDKDMKYEFTTFMRETIRLKRNIDTISEELRLLYVAFTRPKKRLVLLFFDKEYSEKSIVNFSCFSDGNHILKPVVIKATGPEQTIASCIFSHPDAESIGNGYPVTRRFSGHISVHFGVQARSSERLEEKKLEVGIREEELKRRFSFSYNRSESVKPEKVSVTELLKNREADISDKILIPFTEQNSKPKFLSGKQSSSEKGTAVHTFMRWADLDKDLESEINRLICEHRISEADAVAVREKLISISHFSNSELYKRIKNADRIRREEYFLCELGGSLVQGAMDMICVEGSNAFIVDYKTDRVNCEELLSRYSDQVRIYAIAAEKCFGVHVTDAFLWSFYNSESLKVDLTDIDHQFLW